VMLQSIGDEIGALIGAARNHRAYSSSKTSIDDESIFASMSDALVVLDDEARVVRINPAARRLLCPPGGSVIFGRPVDEPQADQWPLGSESVSRQLRPIVNALRHGSAPAEEVPIVLDGGAHRDLRCKASLLINDGSPSRGVMVLREVHPTDQSAAAS
jgi:PAS domain-containing protein